MNIIMDFLTILLHSFVYFKISVSVKSMHVCHEARSSFWELKEIRLNLFANTPGRDVY